MKIPARSPRSRSGRLLVLAVLGATLCGPAIGQWKWRDARGQLHISDVPPPSDVADKDILHRPAQAKAAAPAAAAGPAGSAVSPMPADSASGTAGAPEPAAAPASHRLEAEAEARRAKAEQDEKAKRKAAEESTAAARADNCTRAKQQLATLDSGVRIARTNAQGEREILDDKGRAQEVQRTRGIIASDCKP